MVNACTGRKLTVLPLALYRGKAFAMVVLESEVLENQDTLVDPIRGHWPEDRPMYLTTHLQYETEKGISCNSHRPITLILSHSSLQKISIHDSRPRCMMRNAIFCENVNATCAVVNDRSLMSPQFQRMNLAATMLTP